MSIWTLAEEVSLRFNPKIQSGGLPVYGGLVVTVRPDHTIEGVEIENCDTKNSDASVWFPHLKEGFERYIAGRQEAGKPLGALRISVTEVLYHPVATNERFMRSVASHCLRYIFEEYGQEQELPIR